jgi:hypothetical protein
MKSKLDQKTKLKVQTWKHLITQRKTPKVITKKCKCIVKSCNVILSNNCNGKRTWWSQCDRVSFLYNFKPNLEASYFLGIIIMNKSTHDSSVVDVFSFILLPTMINDPFHPSLSKDIIPCNLMYNHPCLSFIFIFLLL